MCWPQLRCSTFQGSSRCTQQLWRHPQGCCTCLECTGCTHLPHRNSTSRRDTRGIQSGAMPGHSAKQPGPGMTPQRMRCKTPRSQLLARRQTFPAGKPCKQPSCLPLPRQTKSGEGTTSTSTPLPRPRTTLRHTTRTMTPQGLLRAIRERMLRTHRFRHRGRSPENKEHT